LKIGDIIFTGTPAGVGKVAVGDRLEGYILDTKMFDFKIKLISFLISLSKQ